MKKEDMSIKEYLDSLTVYGENKTRHVSDKSITRVVGDNLSVEFRDRLKRDECICPKCECEFGFDKINW